MAPRGLGGCRATATGSNKKRDHPASPVIVFRQLSRGGVSPLGGPAAGGGRAELFTPVPCGCNRLRYRLRSALSPRVGQTNPCIPQGYTARSHHPRAVEHRDCPPCGGGGCSMRRDQWVGDGGGRVSTSGCVGCFAKRWFQRALSPNWRGGFSGIVGCIADAPGGWSRCIFNAPYLPLHPLIPAYAGMSGPEGRLLLQGW
jgi:hypothetical protein